VILGDSVVAGKPRLWSEKPIGGAAGSKRKVDLAPDGKRIVALMPVTEAKGVARGAEPRRVPAEFLRRAAAQSTQRLFRG